MYRRYDDILSRIAEEPTWFDEHAVPRYCEFAPDQIANIYATEAALAEVSCQGCQRVYRVAFSDQDFPAGTIADRIRSRTLRFGDPPNACDDSCMSGASMTSESRKVIEYWKRHDPKYTRHDETHGGRIVTDVDAYWKWVRDPALEIDISPD
jgi:hypothetical protein